MSGDVQSITARPVLWRALLFPLLFVLLGVILATFGFLVFIGTWPLNVRWVLAGIATGLIVGLMLNWRSQPLRLDSESFRGPSRWARVTSIPLDEIDWRIEQSPGLVAWFFEQRVVNSLDGSRKVIIDRWQYRPAEIRRLLAELDRLAGERAHGA